MSRQSDQLIYASRIQDHNQEGFDSVDSEDFDPGYGCVPVFVPRNVPPPPPVPDKRTAWQKEQDENNLAIMNMTDAENEKQQDAYLKSKGIN